jgi:hypothetical protein
MTRSEVVPATLASNLTTVYVSNGYKGCVDGDKITKNGAWYTVIPGSCLSLSVALNAEEDHDG